MNVTQSQNKKVFLYILIAFAFSFAVRLIWVDTFKDVEQFKFNNEFMINTNDGYNWAEGARDIIAGSHQENDLSPIENAASLLTALIVKLVPLQFETVIFYMPAFFGSLLVIPLVLIGYSIKKPEVGLIAALVASIAHSYYNRTMVGYYDTDLLNIVFPTVLLWSLIWAVRTKEDKYILFAAVDIIAYRWWYPQSYSLEFAFAGLIALYVVYQYLKKEDFNYNFLLLTFIVFSMMGLDISYRIGIVILLFIILKTKEELFYKYLKYIFIIALITFFATGGFDPIWNQLKAYVFKDTTLATGDDLKLHFYTVAQTVREAGQIPFSTFSERISGHTITFIASVIGYIWLAIRFPIMLLGLPLVGLGFLAIVGGLRFTVYAVPVMGLGIGFLIVELATLVAKENRVMKVVIASVLSAGVLYPNIKHVQEYKVPTVFSKDEVVVLDQLKNIASREDYVVGWWDYGYPIRYYADVKTLTDGGKHEGDVNFATSFALTNPQDLAAKMIRLDVEYTEKKYKLKDDDADKKRTNIASMTLDNGYTDANDFLVSLGGDVKMLPKTRDVYLFLPNNMLNIYPTVKLFSNIDLMSGMMGKNPFFYKTTNFNENNEAIELGQEIKLLKKDATLQVGQNTLKIKRFVKTQYISKDKLDVNVQNISFDGELNVIFMANYRQFLVVDEETYNSTYFQLFVLEQIDDRYFEPTLLTPLVKIFKMKI